jgi:hypothetical protein
MTHGKNHTKFLKGYVIYETNRTKCYIQVIISKHDSPQRFLTKTMKKVRNQ